MWAEPPRDGSLSAEVATWSRRTRFELVRQVPLAFPTHHPQGLAVVGERIFLSTVELSGRGHVLVLDPGGTLIADVHVGGDSVYHPGGIDVAGGLVWVPVAEYRPESRSMVYTIDPNTLEARARFSVDDHVSWLAGDAETGELYGASWGSRRFYRWTLGNGLTGEGGGPADASSVETWDNPSAYVDFQDAQYDGGGRLLCGGVAELRDARGEAFELGGIAVVRPSERRLTAEVPVPAFSPAGHTIMRNPFVLTRDAEGTLLHVAPDDGDEAFGTKLLTYRIRHDPRRAPRSGKLRTLT